MGRGPGVSGGNRNEDKVGRRTRQRLHVVESVAEVHGEKRVYEEGCEIIWRPVWLNEL